MDTSVVVTGAARGIGRGIAERLVARGHRVVVTDIDGDAVRRTAEEIGAADGLAHDVRDPVGHRAVAEVARAHGTLVAWFNNAGVGFDGNLTDLSEESARALVEVNLLGVVWGMRTAIAAFGPDGGDIVNTASLSAHGPVPGLSVYAATKAAVVSLTSSVSAEVPRRIRVHALCPDGVDTAMVEAMDDLGTAKALVFSGGRILTVADVDQFWLMCVARPWHVRRAAWIEWAPGGAGVRVRDRAADGRQLHARRGVDAGDGLQ